MRVDVPEKLSFALFSVLFAIAAPWQGSLTAVAGLLALRMTHRFRPSSPRARDSFYRILGTLTAAAVLMTVANGIFISDGDVVAQVWGIRLHSEGLLFGLRVAGRLLLIATALLLFFGSTPLSRLAAFLQRAGFSPQIVLTLLLTLYFLQQLPERIERIVTAQEARGARIRSSRLTRFLSLAAVFPPLVLSAMVESVDRGMALELRGFHNRSRLAFAAGSEITAGLSPVSIVFLALSLLCLFWILIPWLLP